MAQVQRSRAISNQSFNQEKKSALYVQGICKPDICDKSIAADNTCPSTKQGLVTEVGIRLLALFSGKLRRKKILGHGFMLRIWAGFLFGNRLKKRILRRKIQFLKWHINRL
jgi:hypothetical protein